MQPEFYPERSSVRLRTTIQLLRSYFESFHPIQLTLCSGKDLIGQTQIPIHKIIKQLHQKSGMEKMFDVLTEEFHLNLTSSSGNERKQIHDDDISQPIVRIEVKLARESAPIDEEKRPNRTRSNSSLAEHETRLVESLLIPYRTFFSRFQCSFTCSTSS